MIENIENENNGGKTWKWSLDMGCVGNLKLKIQVEHLLDRALTLIYVFQTARMHWAMTYVGIDLPYDNFRCRAQACDGCWACLQGDISFLPKTFKLATEYVCKQP